MSDTGPALRFRKMSGAGNDFILVSGGPDRLPCAPDRLAVALCRRGVSVGADGLVTVEALPDGSGIHARFWNPDGSEVGTCGNGTRCAARFAVLEGLAPPEMVIRTADAVIGTRVDGPTVVLRFDVHPTIELGLSAAGGDGAWRGHRVEVGNHHFVVPLERLPEGPIEAACRPIRNAPELQPHGANVNLAEVVDRHSIRIRTYERGVEAETLACGSGSLASALALGAAGRVEPPVAVETRSGEILRVRFTRDGDRFRDLELEGPARLIYAGELSGEALPQRACAG